MDKIVILSTADFDSAVWTNKQHLAVGLAEKHEVVYIESLGLREPSVNLSDLSRVFKKALSLLPSRRKADKRVHRGMKVPQNIEVLSPVVLPFHKYRFVGRLNSALLKHQLAKHLHDADRSTLWTFSPLTYGLEAMFGNVVYHSVDLLHKVPRIPARALLEGERRLLEHSDHVVASSIGVKKHLESMGYTHVRLWQNVAHVGIYSSATAEKRRDQVVFAGNLTVSKVDLECFTTLLDHGLNLAVAGPIDIDGSGSSSDITRFLDHPRVKYHGNLALSELANLFAESKVGLIPYQLNEYTQGVFPMKVYEYLAAGLSVVSTPLPSLEFEPIPNVHLVEPRHFGKVVAELVATHNSSVARDCLAASQGHSWEDRIRQAEALLASQEPTHV